jgi:Pyruvate/2-oxoacid:ferredoxin oxidoreductase gamma subunit
VEREVILTGVGGQGIQLAAQILARAAVLEDRHVMSLGTYGGTMRGGNTDSVVVVAGAPISTPPIVPRIWSALAMHHQFFEPVRAKLRPGALVLVNANLFDAPLDREAHRVFEVPATEMATELGSPLAASMVLLGAHAAVSELVGLEALVKGMQESVPAYRQEHLALNERALRSGHGAAPEARVPAWNGAGGEVQ